MATELERLIVRIEADTERMRRELTRATTSVTTIEKTTSRATQRIDAGFASAQKAALRYGAAIGALLAGGAAVNFLRSTVEQVSALQDTADKLGLNVEALQAYRFAAEQSGVASNTLDLALQRFTRRLGEAQNGGGELLGTLQQYDIAMRNADGTTRSAEAVLRDYADTIAGAGSAQEQLRLAFKAFDSEGAALVNLMREGSAGLDEYRRRAEQLGVIVPEHMTQRIKEAGDAINVVDQQITAANARIAFAAIPLIERYGWLWSAAADLIASGAGRIASALQMLGLMDDPLVAAANDVQRLSRELQQMQDLAALPGLSAEGADRAAGEIARLEAELAAARARFGELNDARSQFFADLMGGAPPATEATDDLGKAVERLEEQMTAARFEAAALAAGMDAQEIALRKALIGMGLMNEAGELNADLTEEQRAKVYEYVDALRALETATTDAAKAAATYSATAGPAVLSTIEKSNEAAEAQRKANARVEDGTEAYREFGLAATSAFEDAVVGGNDLRDVLRGLIEDMARLLLRMTVTGPLMEQLGGAFGGSGGKSSFSLSSLLPSALSFAASAFTGAPTMGGPLPASVRAGGFAQGGTPPVGVPSLVGEKGPELFVPQVTGRIVPAGETRRMLQGSGGGPTFFIDARGADDAAIARLEAGLSRLGRVVNDPMEVARRAAEGFRRAPALRGARG